MLVVASFAAVALLHGAVDMNGGPSRRRGCLPSNAERATPGHAQVTLVTPWLARCDQDLVFPNNLFFSTPAEQEVAIRAWVRQRSGLDPDFRVVFYAGAAAHRMPLSMPQQLPCSLYPTYTLRHSCPFE